MNEYCKQKVKRKKRNTRGCIQYLASFAYQLKRNVLLKQCSIQRHKANVKRIHAFWSVTIFGKKVTNQKQKKKKKTDFKENTLEIRDHLMQCHCP